MKSKKRYCLLVLALVAPLAFAGAHPTQRTLGEAGGGLVTSRDVTEDFVNALLVAKQNYAGEIDLDQVTKSAIIGMLQTLDPHSSFFDPKEWETFKNEQRSRYSGIGSTIGQRNEKVYIISPFKGTPAHRAGIRYGDHIVEVNGESTEGLNSQQVSNRLLGPEGTRVSVKMARLGHEKPIEFNLVRESVSLPSITSYALVGNGVGYISLQRGFNTTTLQEMKTAISELRKQGMTSLVLDLRLNRGGLVDQAWRVADLFLYRNQKILSMRGRTNFNPKEFFAQNPNPEDYPLVVLINRQSASAAEIVAGALQDHDRAWIVGENSFGKGIVQTVFELSNRAGLTLTTGKYYTPSGRLIQREYTGRSLYEYYVRRDENPDDRNGKEAMRTDSGRTVYSGGGIDPDVEVKIPAREMDLQRVFIEPVFHFSRALVAGVIPGFPEYRIERTVDHSPRQITTEYVITDKVVAAFKTWLRGQNEFKALESRVDRDGEWIKRQIRLEVVTAAYGQETASQVALEGDPQMQRAIAEMPKARSMAEDIRRVRASARGQD